MVNIKTQVAGVVILYNPPENIWDNIKSYLDGIDKLYIIDNSEKEMVNLYPFEKNDKVIYKKFNSNMGIAYSLNYVLMQVSNYQWLLTMDQDSCFKAGMFQGLLNSINEIGLEKKTMIISPRHQTLENAVIDLDLETYSEVDRVMTSGNLLNINLATEIGMFDENLFIDEVDHEFCFRARRYGYKVYVNNHIPLIHQLGDTRKYSMCYGLFAICASNHIPLRRYYMIRNRLYVMNLYPAVKKEYIITTVKELVKIILVERNKMEKIKSMISGIYDYATNRLGKKIAKK